MRCLRALSIVLLFTSPAAALKRPQTKAEMTELAAISANMAGEKTAFETSLQSLKAAYKLIDGKIDKEPEIAALKQKLLTLDAAHAVVMTDIVNRTVALYDIQPGPNSGHIVAGELANRPAQWSPVFAPEVQEKSIPREKEKSLKLTAPGSHEAITWEDGSVEVNEKAFLSPGYLGAIILHEMVHYEQRTSEGRGDLTSVRSEMEAHSRSSGQGAVAIFGLTPKEEGRIQSAFMRQMDIFRKSPGALMKSQQFASPGNPEPIKDQSDLGFLDSWRQGSSAVSEMADAARVKLEEERKARAAREAHTAEVWAIEAERKARLERERLEFLNTPWGALLEWAGNACSYMDYYPETVPINYQDVSAPNLQYIAWAETENERRLSEKRRTDAVGKQYILTHAVVLPRDEIASRLNLEGKNLSHCSRAVIEMVQDAPDPIDSRWLVAQLDSKRTGGVFGAILRGISSGLGHAAGALIHGIQSPFVSDGSSAGRPSVREPSEQGARETSSSPKETPSPPVERERPTPTHDPYRQNYRQLRGVASGGSFD